jgi:uncharacterized protein YndB with AHSA1/START domain
MTPFERMGYMKRNLTFEVVYPHAPERVWRALFEDQDGNGYVLIEA